MNNYLIEFRFHGYAKRYLKRLIHEVGRKFRVKGRTKKKVVPHITMFGPFTTTDQRKVVKAFLETCRKYDKIPFKLKGFSKFGNRVVYVDILPSEEMKNLRKGLASNLTKIRSFFLFKTVRTKGISDYDNKYYFHSTIALKDIDRKFDRIWNYLHKKKIPNINQNLLRLTLLKNRRILYEYDFLQRRLLLRRAALSKNVWKRTIMLLKNKGWLDDID